MIHAARALVVLFLLSAMPLAAIAQCDHFRRGDANADGTVDLSDAVGTLLYLFTGGPEPGCRDAGDADDSGKLELTDAIYTLGFLFTGGPPPTAPGPFECGRDETPDELECITHSACDPTPKEIDLSDFSSFTYHQDPGFGFCPDVEKVFTAAITRELGNTYRLDLTTIRPGTEGVDECLPQVRGSPCFVLVETPQRVLTVKEAALVRETFGNVAVHGERDWICECIAIDPCRVAQFVWDEKVAASDFVCASPHVDGKSVDAVLELLETLRSGG